MRPTRAKRELFFSQLDQSTRPLNPLHDKELGDLLVFALEDRPAFGLETVDAGYISKVRVRWAGVYALYYDGPSAAYRPIAKSDWPIYVGQAARQGAAKGVPREYGTTRGTPSELYSRIQQHKKTIEAARNLRPEEFRVRWLGIDTSVIGTAEFLLIDRYRPVWNALGLSMGSHVVGAGRIRGRKSKWHVAHGTGVGTGQAPGATVRSIKREIADHFERHPPRPNRLYRAPA